MNTAKNISQNQATLFASARDAGAENPAKAILIEVANAIINYLQTKRGYSSLKPISNSTRVSELANSITTSDLYTSDKAWVGRFETKQTSYEKCDLAFGFLLALPNLIKQIDDASIDVADLTEQTEKQKKQQLLKSVFALLKKYLHEDTELEGKKMDQHASSGWWQSARVDKTYNSQQSRQSYAGSFSASFKVYLAGDIFLSFAPIANLNKEGAGSNNFMAVFKVLCRHDHFEPVAYDIIRDLQAAMQIDKEGYANCFSDTVYFDQFRKIYIETAAELLLNINNQNLRAVKTILTNVFLLETKCYIEKYSTEINEVIFRETAPVESLGVEKKYEINCFHPFKRTEVMALSDWLLINTPNRGCNRRLDTLTPHPYPTVFERFALRSLKAIEMFEQAQAEVYHEPKFNE